MTRTGNTDYFSALRYFVTSTFSSPPVNVVLVTRTELLCSTPRLRLERRMHATAAETFFFEISRKNHQRHSKTDRTTKTKRALISYEILHL